MLCSRACSGAILLVAVLVASPIASSGQYIVGQGLIREASSFTQAYPETPSIQSSPETSPDVTPAAVAASTPDAPKKATSISSVLVMASADNSTSADTALYAVLRIQGSTGVTPFGYANQRVLLNALGQVISYVNFSDISIMDVNHVYAAETSRRALLEEAEEQLETRATRRRSLLATALSNQADVTVEMDATSSDAAQSALTELTNAVGNSTTSDLVNLLNSSGYGWSVALQSHILTTPGSINATVKTDCHDKFGHWCLDKHKHLSSQGLKGVIAGGVIGIIAVLALLLLLRDLLAARRNRGNEVVYDPRTPTMGATPGKAGTGALTLNAAAGGASPNSRASPTSAGYMGGLAPAGTKVRRMSGAFTSGAVTHPASLAAAGKPTGLEGVVTPVGSPSSANAAHHHGHIV